tara:strand:- start:596 stop:760 length:165 start_codon:yes stop_codon:yes gene_type:complete
MSEKQITVCVRIPNDWNETLKRHVKTIQPSMSKEALIYRQIAALVKKVRKMESM